MHEAAFAEIVRPKRSVILRLAMKPYSIGHDLILLQHGNPLVTGSIEECDSRERRCAIIRAADICSQTFSENNFTPSNLIQRWRHRYAWAKWRAALKEFSNEDFSLAIADFLNYRFDGSHGPYVEPVSSENSRALGCPFHAALIQFLFSHLGIKEREAYDYPLALAKWHYFTHAENEGCVKIPNYEEVDFEEYCRKMDEAAEAKSKEAKCQP